MRSKLGRFHRPMSRGAMGDMLMMNSLGDGSTLSLDFTTMGGVLDPRLTFSRASGGTYVGPDGYIYGVDSATSASLAIGTGSKSVTLTATASVDRRFQVGQTVYFSSGANNMSGLVTAYDSSTQVITINATATTGSGSFTSWFVGNASPRFDYSPTTIGEPRGLLIEGQATNLFSQSGDWFPSPWSRPAAITWDTVTTAIAPDGISAAKQITVTAGSSASVAQSVASGTSRTVSIWLKAGSLTSFSIGLFDGADPWGTSGTNTASIISGPGTISQQIGSLFSVTGLSSTVWTRIQIFRSIAHTTLLAYPGSSSGTVTGTAYVWGAQLELGSGASSYIPTGASQVTRAVDTAIIAAGTNFSSWYTGGTTGTFVSNWYGSASSTTARSVIATSDQTTKHLHMYQTPSALTLRLADFGAAATVTTGNNLTANALTKGAFSYASTATSLCLNGGTVATGTLAFTVAPTWLGIGGPSTNGTSITDTTVMLNNSIRTLKYFPARLSDAQIKEITT